MIVYVHPKCTTCKKALKWFELNDVKFEQKDIRETPPTAKELLKIKKAQNLPLSAKIVLLGRGEAAPVCLDLLRLKRAGDALLDELFDMFVAIGSLNHDLQDVAAAASS